jgi:hypothetical protein
MKTMMGVDLGYQDSTTVVIVDKGNVRNPIKFMSLGAYLEFDEVVHKLALLAIKHEVELENIHIPRHPAVKHALKHRGLK